MRALLIRIIAVVGLVLGFGVTLAAGVAGTAQAAAPPCGTVILAGSSWLGGSGVNVHSNGQYQGTGNSCGNRGAISQSNPSVQDGYAWQCVELATRLYYVKGWGAVRADGGAGAGTYRYGAKYIPEGSPSLTFHTNGSGYVPVPGDLIIFNGTSTNGYGHVAVVDSVAGGKVNDVEENASTDGRGNLTISGSTISGNVRGVEHSPSNHNSVAATPSKILAIKRTTGPDGARQVYAATSKAVTEAYWFPGGGSVQRHVLYEPPDGPITDFDKTTLPNGDQALYTAVPDGVYETWWRAGTSPSTHKVITGRTGVRQVIVDNRWEGSQFVHRIYALAQDGPFEVSWKDGGDGYHLRLINPISNPVTMAKSTGPDGSDQLYVATATWVYELWWRPGAGGSSALVNIPQGDIRSLAKQVNADGSQQLFTQTSTTVWRTSWGRGPLVTDPLITGQSDARDTKKTASSGVDQLYLATSDHVQEYYWNVPGTGASGGSELFRTPWNNITAIDKTTDGAAQQLYTAAGDYIWETWWGGGASPSSTPLFQVTK
jgi:hypothetical protein